MRTLHASALVVLLSLCCAQAQAAYRAGYRPPMFMRLS